MAKSRFSGSDDLYIDLSSPNPSTSAGTVNNYAVNEIWIGDEEDTMPSLDEEAKLKKVEMNLYDELLRSDTDNRKEETQVASAYEDLKKQVLHLKALIAEKDAKLAELTRQDTNLKKNICSLYKTAKAEIDHKNSLMTDTNRKLDSVLYSRNLTVDQLEKQMPQNSSEKCNETSKEKSIEPKAAGRENPQECNLESSDLNKSNSAGSQKKVEQSSTKRKRSCTPPSDSKNAEIEINSYLDKRQNSDSKNDGKNPAIIKSEKSNVNQNHNLGIDQNSPHMANNEPLNKKQHCDSKSGHNNDQSSAVDQEPTLMEVFSRMQELAFNDPAATNAIFFNLLPDVLRQAFLELERSQMDALHKLKQSFVSYYFTQCTSGSSDVPTPEESSGHEAQNSSVFFFPPNSSQPKVEKKDTSSTSERHSDSVSKPQETASEENEINRGKNDLQKPGKKPSSRRKSKEAVLKLHKQRDESLTLYTQRQLQRHQN